MTKFLIILLILMNSFQALAITPNDVVASSLKNFPQVIEAMQNIVAKENQYKESEGAFDAKLKGSVDARTEGYYSGDSYKASIEKPFSFLNSRIYAGKRQSYGDFPVYDGKLETIADGENFAGVSVSLLRDSLIDINRYNMRLREQDVRQAKVRMRLMKINVQTMALQSYWTWLVKGHELKVYQNILKLAQERAKNIAKRIRAGDLARIYESENNQYIVKRKAEAIRSELEFKKASFYLSLFFRDSDGKPKNINESDLPEVPASELAKITDYSPVYKKALQENLDLKVIESQTKQAQLDVRMGNNSMLPKVDINFEWNQDQTAGINRRNQDENRLMLNIEVPIQYRKGLGKKRAGKAKVDQLNTKNKWTREKLRVNVQSLVVKINSFADIFTLTRDQVKLAEKLARAERRKFSSGASDLILVNIREENLAEAQIKNLSSLLKYQFVDAEVKNIEVQFIVE